jgi:protein TonB
MVKRYYFILFFLLVFQNIVSQADTDYVNNNEDPFLIFKCESMPVFKGNLSLFVQDQVQFPSKALIDSVENVVIVSFLVDTTGNTIEHAIVKGLEDEFNTEALRVAKLVKFEKPAMQSGKPVKVKYTIPIKFIPPKQDEKESFNNGIELNLSFDKNPVFLGDSLELRLTYRNRTSEVIDFYPELV